MRIAWLSRHAPTPSQRAELTRLFGAHTLDVDPSPFADAEEVARRIRRTGAAEVVCVAPLSVLQKLLEFGIRPLTAKLEACDPAAAEIVSQNRNGTRYLRFSHFRRLESIDMRYSEVAPATRA